MDNLIKLVYLPDFNQTALIHPKFNREKVSEDNARVAFERYVAAVRDVEDMQNKGIGVEVGLCWSNLYFLPRAGFKKPGLFLMAFPIHKDRKLIFTPKKIVYRDLNPEVRACYRFGDPASIIENDYYSNRKGRGALLFVQNPFLNPERYSAETINRFSKGRYEEESILDSVIQERVPERWWYRKPKIKV